jgi:3-oxoacyl-[acyl-carrier protein] reductase
MEVLITGASGGIGAAIVKTFIDNGHDVHGLDIAPAPVATEHKQECGSYTHHIADVRFPETYPKDLRPEVLINCAGVQCTDVFDDDNDDIDVNLKGAIKITEHFAMGSERIKSVVNISSASAHTGSEFPHYAASKGGLATYTKNIAQRLAPRAIANSIDPGGVTTELNRPVMDDKEMWDRIMELTPLKRWASPEEIAEWVYFVAVTNRFMTGQNLLIDGGEAGNCEFVWK